MLKFKVFMVCDRCGKESESEVESVPTTEAAAEKPPTWQFQQRYDVAEQDATHPMAGATDGGFVDLCAKCKVRISDLMALALNRPLPRKRAEAAEAPDVPSAADKAAFDEKNIPGAKSRTESA